MLSKVRPGQYLDGSNQKLQTSMASQNENLMANCRYFPIVFKILIVVFQSIIWRAKTESGTLCVWGKCFISSTITMALR